MKPSLVSSVRCAKCGGELWLRDPVMDEGEIVTGSLDCAACSSHCPIVGGIPRFVPADNYAASFGFQWNQFRQTQLDSYTGRSVSRDRFLNATGWQPESLAGKTVLDAGCGAGRFAEVALSYGATVFAVDYSCAVEACRANFPAHPNLHVVQGNIYSLPFPKDFFDDIYCLGVLQHTPDPRRAFLALPRHLKPGGRIAVDIYHGGWRRALSAKYWLRPVTARLPQERLFRAVERSMPLLMGLSRGASRIPAVGPLARRILPVANYDGMYGLNRRQLREWAVLDTFDMLSPQYDRPQTPRTLHRWTHEAGLREIEIGKFGHLVARGRKPN
ncbi:MAG TPA: class I SAM-dependent methyltransferase [Planctomycetaceae bacterium]|jgi:SAM-dependent methyltransferase|nr:class I SAM-dependent methyltransferase [Planctomycetaceae bacterium]